ncbi:MAG: DUF1566 domain-containing protein, partial [Bdellovibrionia bacterium]
AQSGDLRFNSDLGTFEGYMSNVWTTLSTAISKRATISTTPYTITNDQAGYYLNYTNSADGVFTLPPLSGLPDGWQVTVVRQVPKTLSLTPSGSDGFANGLQVFEMQGRNLASVTLSKIGNFWAVTRSTEDCTIGQSCWGVGNIYMGIYNGSQYFTTPGNCQAGTPYVCDGAQDSVTLPYATGSEATTILGGNSEVDGKGTTAYVATTYTTTAAAQFCNNINSSGGYAGYTDWYLPARQELRFLFNNAQSLSGVRYSLPSAYWTTTESTASGNWNIQFANYSANVSAKTSVFYVRCIRRF